MLGANDSGQLGEGNASAKPQRTAGCVIDFGDSDHDRICDSADPCNGRRKFARAPGAWLAFRRVNTDAANDGALLLDGRVSLPAGTRFADLDFAREGASLSVVSPGGSEAAFSFPAGAYAGSGTAGWLQSQGGERWSFRDATGSPQVPSRARVTIRDASAGVPVGTVALHAVVRRTNLPIRDVDLPLQAIVVLGDAAAGAAGQCAQTNFRPGSCAVGEGGTRVDCKTPQQS